MKNRIKKLPAVLTTLTLCAALVPAYAEGEDVELKQGDYVQMGTYYGEPILWKCEYFRTLTDNADGAPTVTYKRDKYEKGAAAFMVSDEILCLKAFDAGTTADAEGGSHTRRDASKGSNYWGDSTLRSWLNSEAPAGEVTWLCQNPPTVDGVWNGYNAYDNEAGFLTNFTASELDAVQEVTHNVDVEYPEYDNGVYTSSDKDDQGQWGLSTYKGAFKETHYFEQVSDRIVLLDDNIEGQSETLGMGILSEGAVKNSDYAKGTYLAAGKAWEYWTETPKAGTANNLYTITFDDNGKYIESDNYASNGSVGVRPAFYLKEGTKFASGNGTKDDPYIIADTVSVPTETLEPAETASPEATAVPNANISFITSDWAKTTVESAYAKGIISETLAESDLTKDINREEFAAIAVRLYEALAGTTASEEYGNPFGDIADSIYFDDILKAYKYGITSGTSETAFSPNTLITREQMASMLYRACESVLGDNTEDVSAAPFADDDIISDYARVPVYFMASRGIISGVGDNRFAPNGTDGGATREQAAAVALRCLNYFENQ